MLISADNLTDITRSICLKAGSEAAEADKVARNLVEANLAGHDSHGVGMVPTYIDSIERGRLQPNQHASVISDNGAILVVDGNRGYGQVIGEETMNLGIERAKNQGMALIALRNSHHLGRIGAWGEQCAAAGLVSIHYVNVMGHRPLVTPFGGSDARFTTNPYCTALPATDGNPPVILDMATSKVAMGKIRVAYNKGVDAPEGALIDPDGNPTLDPGVMFQETRGALRSVGEHKGYGLAFICELLAGALTGGGTCLPEREAEEIIVNNMLSILIDPTATGNAEGYAREIDAMTAHVKASPPAPGVEAVMVPGDPERKSRAERGANGIPVDDRTWEEIVETAGKVGIAADDVNAAAA